MAKTQHNAFRRALAALNADKPKAASALFADRASASVVHGWRYHRAPPQWAIDRLAALLETKANETREIANACRKIEQAPGQGSHGNIRQWNYRRAKEKARQNERA